MKSRPILTIDNGNTHPHIGIFNEKDLKEVIPYSSFEKKILNNEIDLKKYQIGISSVGKKTDLIKKCESYATPLKEDFKNGFYREMKVNYQATLGEDRLFQAYYIYKNLLQNINDQCLLIDTGTFITCDFIDYDGFKGGWIFPGFKIFMDSYSRGHLLPSLKASQNIDFIKRREHKIPKTTQEAMISAGQLCLEGYLSLIIKRHSPIKKIIVTGGKSIANFSFLSKIFDGTILYKEHLIHKALAFALTR